MDKKVEEEFDKESNPGMCRFDLSGNGYEKPIRYKRKREEWER